MENELIVLSKSDLETIIRNCLRENTEQLKREFEQILNAKDAGNRARGKSDIAKAIGCTHLDLTEMLKHEALGRVMWKRKTEKGNGRIYLNDDQKARMRYQWLSQQTDKYVEAFYNLSCQEKENIYQEQGL